MCLELRSCFDIYELVTMQNTEIFLFHELGQT
jgi:hypothetical protein